MARTNLPITSLTSPVLNSAGTAIDATNGMNIAIPTNTIPAGGNIDNLVLYVQNTTGSTKTVTIRAGANTTGNPAFPAFESGKGDLVTGNLTATTGTAFIGPFEVARFIQPDGSLNVDFAASMTGTIWALLLPRAF